jgi:pSer/pThr/pTyr-binding forkhead associated (FHA) protein/outer membrane biosynthesis protein TonB
MRKLALQVEHKFKNRTVGFHMLDGRRNTVTIGSSRTADIRVPGEDVSGLHAAIQLDGEEWCLCDLGSESGTWINKKPIIESKIEGATVINIGNHQLKATPHIVEVRDLFKRDDKIEGGEVYHQVVVMRRGIVHDTRIFERTEPFVSEIRGVGTLKAPTEFEWTDTASGIYTIRQRLVKSTQVKEKLANTGDFKRQAPLIGAMCLLFVVVASMFLMPQKPDDNLKTLTPDNQFTRMIFDGKKVRQKKAIAEKLQKNLEKQAAPKNTNKAPVAAKVVMNIKNAGLSKLIGKVAARAAKNALLIVSAGIAADSKQPTGRAFGTGGGSSLTNVGTASKSQRVSGLTTGGAAYKGSAGLATGNVGAADVGVLEEESEVEGGLDKEVIARVIRSQLGQIRYCYERQLSANPDLYGKIMVKFTIGAAGAVTAQSIGTTSLNNAMVEGCILRRIAGWQFPQPKGGTEVLVTYPFLFKSTR